ncbi:hypothetical protein [Acinetobacter proteolyticus]|uniref:hypothetical protein n=1 Tax=Acinetobacter proteolyticus TaxID=1776741 RepID=UPI003D98E4C6
MKMIKQLVQLCLLLIFLPLIACSNDHLPPRDNGNKKSMTPLTLYFNKETGAQFAARIQANVDNPLPTSSTTFYNQHWDKNPIDVLIEHGQNSITLHHVIGVQAGVGQSDQLIDGYSVYAGLTNDNTMNHDKARLTVLAIFKELKQLGWQRVIELSAPRLVGKDTITYASKHTYELDPDYPYTLDEWMQLKDGSRWLLQANGIYMTITMRRDQSKMDPQQPGAYFVSYKFESEKKYYAPYFQDDDLKKWEINAARWIALYPGIKKEMNQIRTKTEAELKAQGIMIDESYQDPPLVSKK